MQSPITGSFLLTEPAFELLGGMRRSIIEDEGHPVDTPSQCFGNDLLLHEGLEIDKAFALATGAIHLAVGHREPGKQMSCAATLITCFTQHRLASLCWARWLLTLTGLNRGFLVEADEPGACTQERSCLGIGLEHRTGPC